MTIENPLSVNGAFPAFANYPAVPHAAGTTSPKMLRGRHFPTLDAVRGLAVLAVMFFHFTLMSSDNSGLAHALSKMALLGRCGVDLFFVLSGFLITGILFDAKQSQGFFKTFYARRILRIFPLYYGALVLFFFILPLLKGTAPLATADMRAIQPWFWTHTVNIGIILHDTPTFDVYGHLWSLAIEEHFYLFWPLVVFFASRKNLLRICVGMVIAPLLLRSILMAIGDNQQTCYLLTFCRADQLAIGGLVAVLGRGERGLTPLVVPARWIAAASFMLLFGILLVRDRFHAPEHDDVMMPTLGYTVVGIGFAASIVLAVAAAPGTWLGTILVHPILRLFGKHSYALYILHPMIFRHLIQYAPRTLDSNTRYAALFVAFGAMSLFLAFLAAWITWHAWEKHFLKLKHHFTYRPA